MKSLLNGIRRKTLLIICALMLLGFHAANFRHGDFMAPVKAWWSQLTTCRLALSSSSGNIFSFRFLTVNEPKPPPEKKKGKEKADSKWRPKLDFANQWLSWTGIHLRALVSQSRPSWINYPYHGKRYYYLRDEIEFQYKHKQKDVDKAFTKILKLASRVVSESGATLVITPMPTKVAINRDRLPAWLPEQELWAPITPYDKTEDAYRVYQAVRRGAPNDTIDAFKLFADYHRQHPEADLYIPSNHQWSSLGIALTAGAIIDNLRGRGWQLAEPKVAQLPDQGELHDAGMLELLNLPPQFGRFYPQTQSHEVNYGVSQVAAADSPGRIFIFGTCYSYRMRSSNGLGNLLGRALRRSNVINLAADGGNTVPSFQEFSKNYGRFQPGDLVIWEFVEWGTFHPGQLRAIEASLKAARKANQEH